jgi:CPA2 family monovalent cation:H+ antiporter-2
MDLDFLIGHIWLVLLAAISIIIAKTVVAAFVAGLLRLSLRNALLVGFALAEIGEFSFVLLKAGQTAGLGSDFYVQLFLNVALLTMAGAIVLVENAPHFVDVLCKLPWPRWLFPIQPKTYHSRELKRPAEGHVVIIGYGESGKLVAKTCESHSLNYVVLDANLDQFYEASKHNVPILFGDALQHHVLKQVHISRARLVVITTSDSQAAARIVRMVRSESHEVKIILRCRYRHHIDSKSFKQIEGVVYDDIESGIALARLVLEEHGIAPLDLPNFFERLREASKV